MENLSYIPKAVVGKKAPAFEGAIWQNDAIKEISLKSLEGKWVVLFFYPLDFTFVCPTEICNFSDAYDTFTSLGAEVIGCSVDSIFSHREWAMKPRKQGGLAPCKLPLLSDITKQIAMDYGVLIDHGADNGVAFRATFIIDPKGVLRQMSCNDLPIGRSIDEVIRLLQALQFTDKHGEVCPAKWKPGKKTMKTDHDSNDLKEFWEKELTKDFSKDQ